jgi:hypothetical protein
VPGGGVGSVYVIREGLKASWVVGRATVRRGMAPMGGEPFRRWETAVSHENDT